MIRQQTQQEEESICRTSAPVLNLLGEWREPERASLRLAFIFLNVFAAAYYYVNIYKKRH